MLNNNFIKKDNLPYILHVYIIHFTCIYHTFYMYISYISDCFVFLIIILSFLKKCDLNAIQNSLIENRLITTDQ